MKFLDKKCIISAFVCLLLCFYVVCAQTKEQEFPEEKTFKNKKRLSDEDLQQSYNTFWRNAVTRDTIVSNAMSVNEKYVSINNGQDFNIPIDDNVMNQPIGTYQYTDGSGDLHIVNYINDSNGLKILNDYKPYTSSHTSNSFTGIQSNDPKPKDLTKEKEKLSRIKYDVEDESNQDINYDEYEFTFMPQEINKIQNKNNNKINDLNRSESNKNIDRVVSRDSKSDLNNNHNIYHLPQVVNSIPYPQPYSTPNPFESSVFMQRPDETNNKWKEHANSQNLWYSMPMQTSAPNLQFQPFINFFN